jgi:hypothetical protein
MIHSKSFSFLLGKKEWEKKKGLKPPSYIGGIHYSKRD